MALSRTSITVYEANYGRHDTFIEKTTRLIRSVETAAACNFFVTTVALRYVSGFKVDGLPASLVANGVRGIDVSSLPTKHFHHDYRFWCDIVDGGRLAVTAKTVHGHELMPREIQPLQLSVNSKFKLQKRDDAVQIDIHETKQLNPPERFNGPEVSLRLSAMRNHAKTAFLTLTTSDAHKRWQIRSSR